MSSHHNPMRRYHYDPYFIGGVTREGSWSELTQLQGIGLAFEPLQLPTPASVPNHHSVLGA